MHTYSLCCTLPRIWTLQSVQGIPPGTGRLNSALQTMCRFSPYLAWISDMTCWQENVAWLVDMRVSSTTQYATYPMSPLVILSHIQRWTVFKDNSCNFNIQITTENPGTTAISLLLQTTDSAHPWQPNWGANFRTNANFLFGLRKLGLCLEGNQLISGLLVAHKSCLGIRDPWWIVDVQ